MKCESEQDIGKVQQKCLSLLFNDGRTLLASAHSAAGLLELDFLKEANVTDETKTECFRILMKNLSQYTALLNQCRDDLQDCINSVRGYNP